MLRLSDFHLNYIESLESLSLANNQSHPLSVIRGLQLVGSNHLEQKKTKILMRYQILVWIKPTGPHVLAIESV